MILSELSYSVGSLKDYISVCGRCGCALKEDELAAALCGQYLDLDNGQVYEDCSVHFCRECSHAIRKYTNDTVRKAWLRLQQLEHP